MTNNNLGIKKKKWEEITQEEITALVHEWMDHEKSIHAAEKVLGFIKKPTKDKDEEILDIIKSGKYKVISSCYGNITHLLLTWPKDVGPLPLQVKHESRLMNLLKSLDAEINKDSLKVTILTRLQKHSDKINGWRDQKDFKNLIIEDPVLLSDPVDSFAPVFSDIKPEILRDKFLNYCQAFASFGTFSPPLLATIDDVIALIVRTRLTTWIQDLFVVMRNNVTGDDNLLLEPDENAISNPRKGVEFIADEIEDKIEGIKVYQKFGWQVEGGNILAGNDFAFVGADQIPDSFDGRQKAAEFLGLGSQREIYVIKSSSYEKKVMSPDETNTFKTGVLGKRQPFFHLDLFMSLAGKNEKGIEQVIVGYPIDLHNNYPLIVEEVRKRIQEVVRQLYNWGFEVIRNPMPFTRTKIGTPNDSEGKKYNWFFAFYNNCLVEISMKNDKVVKRIWLPTFGTDEAGTFLKHYDKDNQQIWESLGFDVHPVGNYILSALKQGGLHCSLKCIERQPFSY